MYPESSEWVNRETDNEVYFFTPAYYCLDNFSAHQVNIWGRDFPTSEHAYQWKKYESSQPDIAAQILLEKSPHAVKVLADANKDKIPPSFFDRRIQIMEEILTAKAKQHQDVRDTLMKTGDRTIIENSPVDVFWGIGPDGKGENMVGKIWMKVRNNLTNSK